MSSCRPQKKLQDSVPCPVDAPPRGGSRFTTPMMLVALVLITLGPRLIGLSDLRFEEDECFYAEMSDQPLDFVVTHAYYSTTYYGWFLPYKLWVALSGGSDVARKSFSLLCGCLSVLGIFAIGRLLGGRRAGLLAALLLAFNGYHFHFSRIASPYAFLMLLGTLIIWSFLLILRDGNRRAALAHTLMLGLAFYCHPAAALLFAAEVAVAGVLALGRRRDHLVLLAISLGGTLMLALGALHMMLHQWQAIKQIGYEPFIPELGVTQIGERIHNLFAYKSSSSQAMPLELVCIFLLVSAGSYSVYRSARSASPLHWPRAALTLIWVLPIAACVAAGLLVAPMMLYEARFFALIVPGGVLLMASTSCWIFGLKKFGRASPLLAGAFLLTFLVPQAGSLGYELGSRKAEAEFPIESLSTYLQDHAQSTDAALVHHSWYKLYFDRYYSASYPKILGAAQSGIKKDVPFGGTLYAITPAQVERELARIRSELDSLRSEINDNVVSKSARKPPTALSTG